MDVINVLNLLCNFYRTHCDEFDETSEENKLVYTEIYQLYTNSVEDYIKTELEKRISNFVMKDFIKRMLLLSNANFSCKMEYLT